MTGDIVLRKNVLIWTLGWTATGLCFFGCYMSFNTIKGDIYFNNTSTALFDLTSSLMALFIVSKFKDLKRVITNIYYLIGILFCSCIFTTTASSSTAKEDMSVFE
jgi:hypothetical protein